jgi:hypothetical protein
MAKLTVLDKVVKVYNVPQKFLDKCLEVIREFLSGTISSRKLNNGKFDVISVGREYRIVIDGDTFRVMNHNHYNKYIDR